MALAKSCMGATVTTFSGARKVEGTNTDDFSHRQATMYRMAGRPQSAQIVVKAPVAECCLYKQVSLSASIAAAGIEPSGPYCQAEINPLSYHRG